MSKQISHLAAVPDMLGALAEKQAADEPCGAPGQLPVVVIGAGPVGVRVAQELHRRAPRTPVVIYGDEACEPYNRVRLSSYLGGELNWQALTRDLRLPETANLQTRFGCAVTGIDRGTSRVVDAFGAWQPYSRLVLATGSRPVVPEIQGVNLPGVYTLRDASDAQKLAARRVRSRRIVVLGGGLLGLEAARAMQRFHTEVCVIEHYDRLMARQLDHAGAQRLQECVAALGIEIVLADSVRRVLGDTAVTGVQLRSGRTIACDTLLVAAGVRPNIELALKEGLVVGRGVRVDDEMRTSDPHIYAVGECAEHRERTYGIVAPGFEQAAVAANSIQGGTSRYRGSILATRLKVLDLPVFSMGPVGPDERPEFRREVTYADAGCYRKLVVRRGRLAGAIAIGDCPQLGRLQEAVIRERNVWPWQLWRFRRTGELWPAEEVASVLAWPANVAVCNCTGVTRGQLGAALASGCASAEALAAATGASTVCGSCRPLLVELAGGGAAAPEPARAWGPLLGLAVFALVAALALFLAPSTPYAQTVDVAWQWDMLWRDNFWKQVSGYTLLALTAVSLLMSLRKRWPRFSFGDFPLWRIAHTALGAVTLAALLVHTGGRLGSQLNLMLMSLFLALLLAGSLAGGVIALEHRLSPANGRRLRASWTWTHILLAWPIPALLIFHVLKTYYF
jgi:nitrite reductase (NADH) large subunit